MPSAVAGRWYQVRLDTVVLLPLLLGTAFVGTKDVLFGVPTGMLIFGLIAGATAANRGSSFGLNIVRAAHVGMTFGLVTGPLFFIIALHRTFYCWLHSAGLLELTSAAIAGAWLGSMLGLCGATVSGLALGSIVVLWRPRPGSCAGLDRLRWRRLVTTLSLAIGMFVSAGSVLYLAYGNRRVTLAIEQLKSNGIRCHRDSQVDGLSWIKCINREYNVDVSAYPSMWSVMASVPLSDADWSGLSHVRRLYCLSVRCRSVNDRVLKQLVARVNATYCEKLWLDFSDSDLGDAHLPHLCQLRPSTNLYLAGTNVTSAGLRRLKSTPKLRIAYSPELPLH